MSVTFVVVKAILQKDCLTFGTMDPHFVAKTQSGDTYKSKVRKNEGKYPVWNEGAKWEIKNNKVISFEVFHENKSLGEARIDLSKFQNETIYDEYPEVIQNGVPNGKLMVKIQISGGLQQSKELNINQNISNEGGIKLNTNSNQNSYQSEQPKYSNPFSISSKSFVCCKDLFLFSSINGITVSATSLTACINSVSLGFFLATASIKLLILCDINYNINV